jgi:hypothetical protein
MRHPLTPLRGCLFFLLVAGLARGQAAGGKLAISVVDKETGKPLPCRVHLKDAAGKAQQAGALPFWRDHFDCPGDARIELPAGKYTYEVEHGPEFSAVKGETTVVGEKEAMVEVKLERLADMAAEGWCSADLHIHRKPADIELLMKAEDLHVAPVITWWNKRSEWGTEKRLPEKLLVQHDGNRYYHLMAGEDEREGGALLYFNLPAPLLITGAGREHPSPLKFLHEARKHKGAWVDIEKPFWWDVPTWLADGQVDSIGIANNHMCRSEMRDAEAWGKPRDRERFPPPLGNGFWTQEIYYQVLNCGLRIPPSAGSASGVLPNPVGYNRVYVQVGAKLSYERFWEGLKAGRSFVTNGPLLRPQVAGQLPGHVFTAPKGKELSLEIKMGATSREPIRVFEVVQNGRVVRSVPFAEWKKSGTLGTLTCKESGWFLVRALVDDPKIFRFASTAPYYVEVGDTPKRISKASAQFFVDWVAERSKRVKLDDATQRQEVLEPHERALRFWKGMMEKANVE